MIKPIMMNLITKHDYDDSAIHRIVRIPYMICVPQPIMAEVLMNV